MSVLFRQQGVFEAHAYGFDARHYAENFMSVSVFNLPCSRVEALILKNHTSLSRVEMIPAFKMGSKFQVEATVFLECKKFLSTKYFHNMYLI